MSLAQLPQIQALSVREKLELVDEIWKTVHTEADSLDVSEEERILMDARWAEYLMDPGSALSLDDFKARLKRLRE
jgi:putative addiction module component (TIGR02574 family)